MTTRERRDRRSQGSEHSCAHHADWQHSHAASLSTDIVCEEVVRLRVVVQEDRGERQAEVEGELLNLQPTTAQTTGARTHTWKGETAADQCAERASGDTAASEHSFVEQ
jgi:hypothetical protein